MSVDVQRTQGAVATAWTVAAAPSTKIATGASTLLPEPATPGLDGMQDAMSMMYRLVSQQGQSAMSSGQIGVETQNREQETHAQEEATALKQEEADEAKLECGSLFGSICHIFDSIGTDIAHGRVQDVVGDAVCGAVNVVDDPHLLEQLEQVAPQVAEYVGVAAAIIGGAALTAATCGAGGVVVAAVVIALSASGMFVSATHCLGKDSAYIGLGLDVAGAIVSCGAASGMVANAGLQTASSVANAASGTLDIVAGAATVVTGHQQADVIDDSADVQQAIQALNRNARLVADLVEGMKETQKSNASALKTVAGAAHTYNQTLTLASAGKA